jgi:hypothetical protein
LFVAVDDEEPPEQTEESPAAVVVRADAKICPIALPTLSLQPRSPT